MPSFVVESYTPLPCAANFAGSVSTSPCYVAGFTCTVAGTLELRSGGSGGTIVLGPLGMLAGTYYPMPYSMPAGAYLTLTGGAAGTLVWTS